MIQYPMGVEGVTTRVLEAGTGDDLVVLVHGVGARADRWARVLGPLAARGYHVVAVDLPGHGLAQKGPGFDYSVPGYSRFVEGVLDHLGRLATRTVLVGTSLGGHICGALTVRRPELVSALVLVGSTGLRPWGDERRAATRARLADASIENVARKLALVMYDQSHVTDELIREESAINSSPGARESLEAIGAYIAEHLDDELVLDGLAAVADRVPIQLVWGREERSVVLEIGEEAHARIPGSELAVIDRTAHAPFYEQPDEFVDIVDHFLRRRRIG
jgi:pimeloyl-ACP methyl ester carboxylesterase